MKDKTDKTSTIDGMHTNECLFKKSKKGFFDNFSGINSLCYFHFLTPQELVFVGAGSDYIDFYMPLPIQFLNIPSTAINEIRAKAKVFDTSKLF